ncbi:inositol transport system permease protein [Klebsiella pneumoniae]|uniref:Inositol transport system permease protein n=1 Tax=Klebsiella pneumoniae TaxID=573 RepID=A0A7H9ZWZ8_KLEPN|nr:inositol transport system permease protein [Klebsiella pneumoniae]
MSNMKLTAAPASEGSSFFANLRHKMPKDTGIFVVMLVIALTGNDSNLLIVFYVQIMPDDFVMQLHRF